MHARATTSNGTVLAEASEFEFVEGNVYFPPSSIVNKAEVFTQSSRHTTCPWKGESSYYDIHADGKTLQNAAWYYPQPLEKAHHIKDHIAFDKSQVHVEKGHAEEGGEHQSMKDKLKHVFKG